MRVIRGYQAYAWAMVAWLLAVLLLLSSLVPSQNVLDSGAPDVVQPTLTPWPEPAPLPRAKPAPLGDPMDPRSPFREASLPAAPAGPVGRLVVSPRLGLAPLLVRVTWSLPRGLYGPLSLTATQTDIEPVMVVCRATHDLQGRADVLQASWQLPEGLFEVAGCYRGRCRVVSVVSR